MRNRTRLMLSALLAFACAPFCHAEEKIDFTRDIQPLIESACLRCHQADDADGELRLDSRAAAIAGGENGAALVPGKPDKSPFYAMMLLAADEDGAMPPDGPRLDKSQTDRIKKWILAGAEWPTNVKLQVQPRIDFVKHVQPLLEQHCVACHRPAKAKADLDLSTRRAAMSTGGSAPVLIPLQPLKSSLYTSTILPKSDSELMPPVSSGGPLEPKQKELLRLWIAQGALWPESIRLKPRAKDAVGPPSPDNRELVKKIHSLVVANDKKSAAAKMTDYEGKIPKTGVAYHMVAIRGGSFTMGSPAGEAHRVKHEGPQVKVHVDPFWIGKFEVTWDEYEPFMITQVDRAKHGARIDFNSKVHTIVDAVSQPTPPYVEMSFGMGQKGYPAISMTQHAASKYCQWLSAQTGHFYRLPTEAEWEYACRAGTTTAYSFGDDASKIDQYAWYYENSNEKYQKVGKKKPNPWGLYDMHGNVMEWTIDQFTEDYFTRIAKSATNPFAKPDKLYPRSVRGGNWDDDAEQLRSAFRRGSAPEWKQQDPQLPKSIWYHTNATGLGLRIVRPKKTPTVEEMEFYWNSAKDKL